MFTGIIRDIGEVTDIVSLPGDDKIFYIDSSLASALSLGSSISCSGVCLTVMELDKKFAVQVSEETMRCTNLSNWQKGSKINLEPSLRLGDYMDGHIVYGHVDGTAELLEIRAIKGSHELVLKLEDNQQFLAKKGSIALEGISLTVNEIEDNICKINIIPYTWQCTNLQYLEPGSKMNIEIDIMARYAFKWAKELYA